MPIAYASDLSGMRWIGAVKRCKAITRAAESGFQTDTLAP